MLVSWLLFFRFVVCKVRPSEENVDTGSDVNASLSLPRVSFFVWVRVMFVFISI